MIEVAPFEKLRQFPLTLSQVLNSPPDQIYLVLGLLLSSVLGFVFRVFRHTFLRQFVSLGWGLFLLYYGVGYQALFSVLGFSISVYILVMILPRESVGLGVTTFAMLFISVYHIYRMIYDYGGWTIDSSVILMYSVMRSSMFANAFSDGLKSETTLAFTLLTSYQREYRIVKTPTFFDFMSYMFFFSTVLIGPNQEYNDFRAFMEKREQFKQIPLTIKPTLLKILIGIGCILVKVKLAPLLPISYSATVEFGSKNILYKLYYIYISLTFERFKFYVGWSLADASAIASGSSYTKEGRYDLFYNINIWDLETSTTEREIKEHWNHSTASWLKHCIYQRLINHSIESNSTKYNPLLITSMVCAFWHGFYPTYYIGFTGAFLLTEVSRVIYRRRQYFRFMPVVVRKYLSIFLTFTLANYIGALFTILKIPDLAQFLINLYGLPFIVPILLILTLPKLLPVNREHKKRAHLESGETQISSVSTEAE